MVGAASQLGLDTSGRAGRGGGESSCRHDTRHQHQHQHQDQEEVVTINICTHTNNHAAANTGFYTALSATVNSVPKVSSKQTSSRGQLVALTKQ